MSKSRDRFQLHEGIHEIGFQHQQVWQYYKRVGSLLSSEVEDHVTLEAVMDGLVEYSINCFELEQRLMELVDYERAAEHLKSHDMFMHRLSGCRAKFLEGTYTANELMFLLKVWVTGHLEEQDAHLIGVLQTHCRERSPEHSLVSR